MSGLTNFVYPIRTLKGTHFTTEIAQNAFEDENIVLAPGLGGVGGKAELRVKSISILSDQNLAWELQLYSKDTFEDADLDLDVFIGRWSFVASDAVQLAGAGKYYYYIDGNDMPYVDEDKTGELHIKLVNRSAVSKTAGAAGEIVVTLWVEPLGN